MLQLAYFAALSYRVPPCGRLRRVPHRAWPRARARPARRRDGARRGSDHRSGARRVGLGVLLVRGVGSGGAEDAARGPPTASPSRRASPRTHSSTNTASSTPPDRLPRSSGWSRRRSGTSDSSSSPSTARHASVPRRARYRRSRACCRSWPMRSSSPRCSGRRQRPSHPSGRRACSSRRSSPRRSPASGPARLGGAALVVAGVALIALG